MEKKKIVLYGAGNNLTFAFYDIGRHYEILAVTDGNVNKKGQKCFRLSVSEIEDVLRKEYDYVVITPANAAGIKENLIGQGVDKDRLISLQEAFDLIPEEEWGCLSDSPGRENNSNIAVVMCGGMGDLLIGRTWLESVIRKYKIDRERIHIHVFQGMKEDGTFIFKGIVPEQNIYVINVENDEFFDGRLYDTVLRFCIVPEVCYKRKNINSSEESFEGYINRLWDYGKDHYNRGFIAASGFCKTIKKLMVDNPKALYHTAFDVFGNLKEYADTVMFPISGSACSDYLRTVDLGEKKYITLNTGLNAEYRSKKNMRAWSFDNWITLARELKNKYPDITLVQVGIKMRDEDNIPADVNLNGDTSLEQIFYLMKNALLHIDYDGGLVHVRHMTGGRSIVLMGPSSAKKHAYPENVYIQTDACEPCEWDGADWLSVCGRDYDPPLCMSSISVDAVINAVEKIMEEA